VHISKSFDVTRHQVTHEQWKFITGKYRREWIPGPKHPAFVRWNDTQDFIKKMNERKDGYRYRLLTDAEWEYIARAEGAGPTTESSDRVRSYGQIEWTDQVAVELLPIYPGAPPREPSCGMDLGQKPCPTPKRFSNPWGLYDILGDTPEWVEDWYGTPKEGGRLVRGGVLQTFMRGDGVISLLQPPRVWHKATGDPKKSRNGFRLAREQLK
jgi:formylglycine-generating enzyme required for sulfatase activity